MQSLSMTRDKKITVRHCFLLFVLLLSVNAFTQNTVTHTVQEGETISSVSEKYNISVDELLKLNPNIETGLVVGQEINVPESLTEQTDTGYTIDYVADDERELGESEGQIPVRTKDKYLLHVVKEGETIYDIAKTYAVDIAELQEYNDLDNFEVGKVIRILNKRRNDNFITHYVDKSIKTSAFVAMWNVDENEFKAMNPGVSRTICKGRYVYIPIHVDKREGEEPFDSAEDEFPDIEFECEISEENMTEQYHVALLVPFYTEQIDSTFATVVTNERSNLKVRQFQFAQFYEGFMLAVDSLVNFYGLNLKLDVYDVGQSVDRTRIFLADSLLGDVDLIVGPFYAKSFALVSEFAKKRGIMIVNPFSTRENVIVDNPRVVKVKPSRDAQYRQIVDFIKDEFSDYKISVFQMNAENGAVEADTIAGLLESRLDDTISVQTGDLQALCKHLSDKNRKTQTAPLQSFSVEGIAYSVDTVMSLEVDSVLVPNVISRYNYLVDSINVFCNNGASVLRKNLVVACGDDIVFATEMLNKLNMVTDTFDITLIGLPEWGDYHQLFIENLLKTNTVFFEDKFIDYSDFNVRMFVQAFRDRYDFEPEEMAFEGFDIAWYFMKAFMRYGHNPEKCLSEYRIPLLGLQYNFDRFDINNGQSNSYWHIYQYRDFNKVLRR